MAERQSLDGMEAVFHSTDPLLGRTDEDLLVTQHDLEARIKDLPESSLYRQRRHAQRLLDYVRFEQLARRGLLDQIKLAQERDENSARIEHELGGRLITLVDIAGALETVS